MSGSEFQQIEELFHKALALPPAERAGFLDEACAGKPEVRAAVEELLRHDDDDPTDQVLLSPAARLAAELRPTIEVRPGAAITTGWTSPDIDGYEIQEELGRGGMGVVYKARQFSLDRLVALKMLLPGDLASAETLGRFRSEAEALARLHDTHIIPIYEIGMHEGLPYFTMEYVAGPSLAKVLDGRPQDAIASARLVETLARTIHTVHQHGIIHRDLKPGNILLVDDGVTSGRDAADHPSRKTHQSPLTAYQPKISDFGLAKDQTVGRNLTATGVTMGTPNYMAPEQARATAGAIGPAVDIYALGSILYEMLTGRPPFDAPTAAETITQLLHDEPISPLRLRPKLPRDLATICLKCLEKTPAKRYGSAWDLAEDLRRFQAGEPIQARPVGAIERTWRWCRRRPLVAGLSLLSAFLAVVLVVTTLFLNHRLQEALTRAENKVEEERLQIIQLDIKIGNTEMEHGDAFTALLRFTEALRLDAGFPGELKHRRRIAQILRSCPRLVEVRNHDKIVLGLTRNEEGGRLILSGGDGRVEICDVMTGKQVGPVVVIPDLPASAAISADERSLATIHADGKARIWGLSTGKSRELSCDSVLAVIFHKDGTLITQHADAVFRSWDRNGKELRRPVNGTRVAYAVLSNNANWLFTVDQDNIGRLWEVGSGKTVGKDVKMGQEVTLAAVSSDGQWVAVLGQDNGLRVWNVMKAGWVGKPIHLEQGVGKMVVGSSGGRLVVATQWEDHARIWDAATAKALTPRLRNGGSFAAVGFFAVGQLIATTSRMGTVRIWELPGQLKEDESPDMRPIAQLTALAQVLSGARIDEWQQQQSLQAADLLSAWKSIAGQH
jgi:serine/threonine protein kinase